VVTARVNGGDCSTAIGRSRAARWEPRGERRRRRAGAAGARDAPRSTRPSSTPPSGVRIARSCSRTRLFGAVVLKLLGAGSALGSLPPPSTPRGAHAVASRI